MRNFDFTTWQGMLSTLFGLVMITLVGVGIRLLVMQRMQEKRARENRQINERLRTLIAAYKTLGGSFTGDLSVDPAHLRDLLRRPPPTPESESAAQGDGDGDPHSSAAERARRVRDAVEAALSDIILLGTDEQVRLAASAAAELAEGRLIHTHELVVSLRDFIRQALDLEPIPADLAIPRQGPTRPASGGGGGGRGGGAGGGGRGGGGGGGMGGMGGGMGMGMGAGMGLGSRDPADAP